MPGTSSNKNDGINSQWNPRSRLRIPVKAQLIIKMKKNATGAPTTLTMKAVSGI